MNIYFVQSGDNGTIKIGVTKDIDARIKNLQTGNHRKLKLLACVEAGEDACFIESYLHNIFKDYRLEGEWFKSSPWMLSFISDFKDRGLSYLREAEYITQMGCWDVISKPIEEISVVARNYLKWGNVVGYRYLKAEIQTLLDDIKTGRA